MQASTGAREWSLRRDSATGGESQTRPAKRSTSPLKGENSEGYDFVPLLCWDKWKLKNVLLDQKWCTELLSELVNSNETVTVVNVSLVDVSLWKRNGKKLNVPEYHIVPWPTVAN